MTSVPPYIPPHLRGKVSDFRQEADGDISFAHPQAALGLGPEFSRQTITPATYDATFNQNSRAMDLAGSLKRQYGSEIPGAPDPVSKIRDTIASWLRSAGGWGMSNTGRAIGTSALAGAGIGAGLGAFYSHRNGQPMLGRSVLAALVGAGLGAGGMGLLRNRHDARQSYLHEKTASSVGHAISEALLADRRLSSEERYMLLRLVSDLNRADQERLSGALRMAAGAGAGAMVARFLSNKGLLPMFAGGILGALVAAATGGPRKNPLGQYVF